MKSNARAIWVHLPVRFVFDFLARKIPSQSGFPRFPPALRAGARISLVSPAGPIAGEEDLERARDNVRSLGWEPVTGIHAAKQHGYLAGEDAHRTEDLNDAIRDERIDGIWCVRGGYGAIRLLDQIDYESLTKRPKAIVGYSDITAIHSAVSRTTTVVTFHGPTARERLTDFSRASLTRALVERTDPCGVALRAREVAPGRANGRLAGGNLAMIASLVGTRYAVDLAGAILVLEDVNEPLYRIDRMLHQLLLSGALDGCRAIAVGDCSGAQEDGGTGGLDELFAAFAKRLHIPCLAGIPVGHVPEQWTIPLGAAASLDTAERKLNVSFTGAAT